MPLVRQRNLSTIGAVVVYVVGLIGCITAYGLIRGGSCPISSAVYYLANISLAILAVGVVVAGIGAVFLRSVRAGVGFIAGVLVCGASYLVLGAVGVGCSGI